MPISKPMNKKTTVQSLNLVIFKGFACKNTIVHVSFSI